MQYELKVPKGVKVTEVSVEDNLVIIECVSTAQEAPKFKRGDILTSISGPFVLIFDRYNNDHSTFNSITNDLGVSNDNWKIKNFRHATSEEINKFDKYLKGTGKKWNKDTLRVEELDIPEIVADANSARDYLGIDIFDETHDDKLDALLRLIVIAEAWNKFDEFKADWGNRDQLKYAPMFKVRDGKIEFPCVGFVRGLLDSHTSNFSFKTEERAKQFGEQFIDLFKVSLGF